MVPAICRDRRCEDQRWLFRAPEVERALTSDWSWPDSPAAQGPMKENGYAAFRLSACTTWITRLRHQRRAAGRVPGGPVTAHSGWRLTREARRGGPPACADPPPYLMLRTGPDRAVRLPSPGWTARTVRGACRRRCWVVARADTGCRWCRRCPRPCCFCGSSSCHGCC